MSDSDLPETARAILSAFADDMLTEPAKASQIRDEVNRQRGTEHSTNNINNHCREELLPREYIEVAETKDEGYPIETKYFQLTEMGESVAEESEYRPEYQELQERVDRLERELDEVRSKHKAKINEIAQEVTELMRSQE